MASVLLTISGAAMNALLFSGTNFLFSKLTDHGEKECKRHDLAFEKLQKIRDEQNEDRMRRIDLSMKDCVKRMKQEHTLTMLMKQC